MRKKKKKNRSREVPEEWLLMRCRQKVGTSPVPAAPCSHPSPPIAPSVSARGCPGFPWLDERFHPFPSTPTFPLLFPEPTTPGPIPHPARLPPATTTKSKSLFLAPRIAVHTAPHQYSRLSRASTSLPWPLHVIPSADTKNRNPPFHSSETTNRAAFDTSVLSELGPS